MLTCSLPVQDESTSDQPGQPADHLKSEQNNKNKSLSETYMTTK